MNRSAAFSPCRNWRYELSVANLRAAVQQSKQGTLFGQVEATA